MKRRWVLIRFYLRELVTQRGLWLVLLYFGGYWGVLHIFRFLRSFESPGSVALSIDSPLAASTTTIEIEMFSVIGSGLIFLAVIMALLVAPHSRKTGTTQFVLSVPISRLELAVCQFAALTIFVFFTLGVLHCFSVWWFWGSGTISATEMAWGWIFLAGPALLLAIMLFAFSLLDSISTVLFLVLLVLMFFGVLDQTISFFSQDFSESLVRVADNLRMLAPRQALVSWPQLPNSEGLGIREGFSGLIVLWLHSITVAAFWTLLGVWLYLYCQIGSRLPQK